MPRFVPRSRLGKAAAAGAGLFMLAVAVVGGHEGLRTSAYRDVVGVPTICFGETRGVQMGDRRTVAECREMLGDRLIEFSANVDTCLDDAERIPDKTYVAFVSLAYNIGVAGFCRSTVVRRANAGDLAGACDAMSMWNKGRINGRLTVIRGLDRRRREERALCLEGLEEAA